MNRPDLLARLRSIVGADNVFVGRPHEKLYSYDASLAEGHPWAVVLPADAREVSAVVVALNEAGVPFLPRGFGTNLSGGCAAPEGAVIVGLARLNHIIDIQPENRIAIVEPGVTNLELQNALAPMGYFYAPDPASQKVATLGGNASENSGGPKCLKYGVTTNHILGLDVILPSGQPMKFGGPQGDCPGYDLRGVLIGGEGTLGIITSLVLRILPKPETVTTLLVVYDDVGDAARTVADVISAGIVPAALEMMDQPVIHAVEANSPCGYPLDAAAVLIVEVEGIASSLESQIQSIQNLCRKNGCREIKEAQDLVQRDKLWAGRRGAFGAVARLAPRFLVCDCTVPRTKLPMALEQTIAIARKYQLLCGNVFHAGDGNLHPLLFFDPRQKGQTEIVHRAGFEIMEACVNLGGTISGEHGIGKEKREAMRLVCSEDDLAFMRSLKKAFDPKNLLNPDKIVPGDDKSENRRPPADFQLRTKIELHPADEQEAADQVCQAFVEGLPLLPVGRGHFSDFGNFSPAQVISLSSEGLAKVLDYDPPNQVVVVEAGIALGQLQTLLSESGQWLPLRPPLAENRTLGGIAALCACGPERLAYGAPRDLMLGLRFVSGQGKLISAGGRVVKNVSGYDLTRLLVGSGGTLGFLVRLIFKVAQKPEACQAVLGQGTLSQCQAWAREILGSNLNPAYVAAAAIAPKAPRQSAWLMKIGFEGLADSVAVQAIRCEDLRKRHGLSSREGMDYLYWPGPWDQYYASIYNAEYVIRADLTLKRLKDFVESWENTVGEGQILVDFGCGRVLIGVDDLPESSWLRLSEFVIDLNGTVLLERAPLSFKQRHDVFGPARQEWSVVHQLKQNLDPGKVFAPGRLPGKY
jgi:glycolate oxidase subunit GlcD